MNKIRNEVFRILTAAGIRPGSGPGTHGERYECAKAIIAGHNLTPDEYESAMQFITDYLGA